MDDTAVKPDLLTVKEAAYMLRVDPKTIYRWCSEGKIRHIKIVGSIRIKKDCIETASRAT